ncbi:MAG: HlyD family secretion protein [Tepidisphaeraceae bacterium]
MPETHPETDHPRHVTEHNSHAPLPPDHPPPGMKPHEKKKKDEEKDDRPFYKRPIFLIAMLVLIIGGVAGLLYWLNARHYESTDDAFIDGHIIQISPQVSARVEKVYIDDNTLVKAGDPLVDLDPTDYQVILDRAKGNEAAAQGKLEQAKAQVTASMASRDEAQANVDAANIAFQNADEDLKRYEALDERARSKQQFDNAVTAQKNAAAQVAQAKAKLASAESQIVTSRAAVLAAQGDYQQAVANRRQAEVNLGYCHITAPSAGRITRKTVEPGAYATVGGPFFSIVPGDVWVTANYKETQLDDMRVGQPVDIEVDAYSDKTFHGRVQSIQAGTGAKFSLLPPENATGNYVKVVQRVPVKITFDPDESQDNQHLLAPGMSVVPKVKVR